LYLGVNAGGVGTYSLSNGATLTEFGSEYVGSNGAGAFNQTGGNHTFIGSGISLIVAFGPSSSGTYNLSGGVLSSYNTIVGNDSAAAGVFNQSGGTHSISLDLTLATGSPNSRGTYAMSSGATLNIPGGSLYVGSSGNGTFTQTGGSTSIHSGTSELALILGNSTGASGTLSISGGSLALTVATSSSA